MISLPYTLHSFGLSDVGLVREKNEDMFVEAPQDFYYAIADGMGGHRAGDVAAKASIHSLCALTQKLRHEITPKTPEQIQHALQTIFHQVNHIIYNMGQQDPSLRGMGTTLVLLYFTPQGVFVAHVGDSRAYILRNGHLTQITSDHSLVGELESMGQICRNDPSTLEYKNILTRAIGTEADVIPDINFCPVQPNDLFFLCTDGLTDMIPPQELEKQFIDPKDSLDTLGWDLIRLAKKNGGHDNITFVAVQVTS